MREVSYETEMTDEFIGHLKTIKKQIENPKAKLVYKPGHQQLDYKATLIEEPKTCLIIFRRQNIQIPQNFSCGIRLDKHILVRYNGHHPWEHKNLPGHEYEKIPPFTCHIHEASEWAFKAGKKLEYNATPTDRYNDLDSAWRCLVDDYNVVGVRNQLGML